MADGKTQSTGCQSLLFGKNKAYRVQTPTISLKDTVLLILAHRTLRQLLKPFRAAAGIKHRRNLLTPANIFAGKERLCTPDMYECV
jgi:hypothetical protein